MVPGGEEGEGDGEGAGAVELASVFVGSSFGRAALLSGSVGGVVVEVSPGEGTPPPGEPEHATTNTETNAIDGVFMAPGVSTRAFAGRDEGRPQRRRYLQMAAAVGTAHFPAKHTLPNAHSS